MKILSIARKILLEYIREPILIVLIFAFPLMLLILYYVAFGQTDQGLAKYLTIAVANEDQGPLGKALIDQIRLAEFEGSPVFAVTENLPQAQAEIALRERKLSMLMILPSDLSQSLVDARENQLSEIKPAIIVLSGDPNSDSFLFARSMLEAKFRGFSNQVLNRTEQDFSVSYEFLTGTGTTTDFEFGVPGTIVFGIMFMTITTTMTMVRERVSGTLRRLRLTAMNAADHLLGVTLAQMVLALFQGPFIFIAALLMGFHCSGSYALALIVILLLNLSAVGLGLCTACFARNDGEAANLSSTVCVLLVLVSGAMYPMPPIALGSFFGRTWQIYDLLPPAHGTAALRGIMIYGDSFEAIGLEILSLTILAVVLLAGGIWMHNRLALIR